MLQNCVSIVGLGGRTFTSLCDYGFQKIIEPQLFEFAKAGIPLNLKSEKQPAVHAHLNLSADQVRDAIKNTLNGQPISIQLDIATRLGRSMFGINAQFAGETQLVLFNIGMIELDKTHTGENLSKVYQECLDRYGIIKQQVMSISLDNGKNVQKFVRIEQENSTSVVRRLDFGAENVNITEVRNNATVNDEIEAILATEEIADDDDTAVIVDIFGECGIDINAMDQLESQSLLKKTAEIIQNEPETEVFSLTGVNCSAHTLQLLVKDSLKDLPKETRNIIDLCRRVIKALKLNSTKAIIDEAKKHIPSEIGMQPDLKLRIHLDVETRWGSTFEMVCNKKNLITIRKCN